jgi:hypothetical protein
MITQSGVINFIELHFDMRGSIMGRTKLFSTIILTGLILTCWASSMRAAEPSFSIDSYIPEKFVDFRWSVDGSFQLGGQRHDSNDDYVGLPLRSREATSSYDRQSLRLSTSSSYRYETIPRFLSVSGGISANAANRNSRSSNIGIDTLGFPDVSSMDSDSKDYNFAFSQTTEAGQYIVDDFFVSAFCKLKSSYWEIPGQEGTLSSTNYYQFSSDSMRMNIYDRRTDFTSERKTYSFDVRFMPGWGRVYEGQYAATALYMVDELKREGLLRRTPSAEEMRALTEIIYQYRLKHVIDKRLHKIEALSQVLDYLQKNDIADNADPYGYLLIQDVWDYFPNFYRPFGSRIRVGAGVDMYFSRSRESSDEEIRQIETEFYIYDPDVVDTIYDYKDSYVGYHHEKVIRRSSYLSFLAEYFKPISLRWQIDLASEVRYYFSAYQSVTDHGIIYFDWSTFVDRFTDSYTDYNAYHVIDLWGAARYIHDSRTSAEFETAYTHNHRNSSIRDHVIDKQTGSDIISLPERYDTSNGKLTLRSSIKYRISIPTTLSVNLQYDIISSELLRDSLSEHDDSGYSIRVNIIHHLY